MRYEVFPILESYPLEALPELQEPLAISNMLNARIIERQVRIDGLLAEQAQDRVLLTRIQETLRVQSPRPQRRGRL